MRGITRHIRRPTARMTFNTWSDLGFTLIPFFKFGLRVCLRIHSSLRRLPASLSFPLFCVVKLYCTGAKYPKFDWRWPGAALWTWVSLELWDCKGDLLLIFWQDYWLNTPWAMQDRMPSFKRAVELEVRHVHEVNHIFWVPINLLALSLYPHFFSKDINYSISDV